MAWTQSPNQDITADQRGWPKGKRRKWDKETEQRIKRIHTELTRSPDVFYDGATAIALTWRKRYTDEPPPLVTIGRILSDLGLSQKRKRARNKGAARYLCYPEHTIYTRFKGRVLEADFIGQKYITGRSQPLNFIGFSFKKAPKIRYYERIESQTATCFQSSCMEFFRLFEIPDYLKVDNCLATIGSASGKRNISSTMSFLLERRIVPIFSVPRKPFSQASIEGNNSVFSRKFWNQEYFQSLAHVDRRLQAFNKSSLWYLQYQQPKQKRRAKQDFIPKVYFIRQVREDARRKRAKGYIDVLHEPIHLPTVYVNYYVLAEWNLKTERCMVYFEKNKQQKLIKQVPFQINQKSKNKCSHFI